LRGIVSFFPGSPSPLGPLNTLSLSKTSIKFKSGGSWGSKSFSNLSFTSSSLDFPPEPEASFG
jgi:hypothetical protein